MNKSNISIALLLNTVTVNNISKENEILISNISEFQLKIEKQIKFLSKHFNDVFLISNQILENLDLNIEIISEVFKINHYLSGIHTALIHSKHQNCLIICTNIVPVDMKTIDEIIKNFKNVDICNVIFKEKINYSGLYSKKSISHLDHMLKNNILKLSELSKRVKTNSININ